MLQDIRYAIKLLARDRGFTLVAALALALGIAATTSLITIVVGLVLLVVASVTCLVPARRATRIQSVAVLRAG